MKFSLIFLNLVAQQDNLCYIIILHHYRAPVNKCLYQDKKRNKTPIDTFATGSKAQDGIENMQLESERVRGKKQERECKSYAHKTTDEKVNETVLKDVPVRYVEPSIVFLVLITA
jgi:hypothetical protein